jgi:hypothetical protein
VTPIFDPSIPVIVGGIAGMTLSMTGVKNMFEMGKLTFFQDTHLGAQVFTPAAAWGKVLRNTMILIGIFFLSELCIFGYFLAGDGNTPASALQSLGYVVLILALLAMIIVYFYTLFDTTHTPPKKMKEFEAVKKYPKPVPPQKTEPTSKSAEEHPNK